MRQRGLTYPYEIIRMLTPPARRRRRDLPPGEFVEHDLDADGQLVPVDRPYGQNTANIVVGLITNVTEKYPEGMTRVILLGDPSRRSGSLAEPECRAHPRRARPGRADARAARVVRALGRREDLDGERHREHGLDRPGAAPAHRVHAGRRRDQHHRHRHQRRRPAVLERRGDDADAHARDPDHDAGGRDGADRARRRSTTRARCRPRTTWGSAATSTSWGRTARRSTGRATSARPARSCCGTTTTPTSCRASGSRAGPSRATRSTATSAPFPHGDVQGAGFALVGDVFSDEKNPGRKKPFDIRKVMRAVSDQDHEPLERWAAHARRRDRGDVGRPRRRLPGAPARLRVARRCRASGIVPPDGPGAVHVGHAVPDGVEEDGARSSTPRAATARSSSSPTSRASTARPSRCGAGSSSGAPRSAGRSSTSRGRSSSSSSRATTAARSSSSRRR